MTQNSPVIIAGGGIGGLTLALTLHQIGVPCLVLESVAQMRPMGVGINLQPNAVRELFALGIEEEALDDIGVPAREWALVGLNGKEVYAEPRGQLAGYNWPQYAVHRGEFHMLLYKTVLDRMGPDAVQLGSRITSYEHSNAGVTVQVTRENGTEDRVVGRLLIGADGIHSTVRAQMHPDQPPIHWGGALMWRGTVRMKPLRTGSSFVGLGTHEKRMVIYPISPPDESGTCLVNWIAEVTVDNAEGWQQAGWFRPVEVDRFIHHFDDFRYDWLDVPDMLRRADSVFENPMIDRDPIPTWVEGPVALMGDAAHAMYPTGSNGASQAIVDARVIGAQLLAQGVTPAALAAYDAQMCGPISALVLRNRGAGPFGMLNLIDERCRGVFEDIETVLPAAERQAFMANYKAAAGFAIDSLNAAPPTLPVGAQLHGG
ncbi:flavin-dependent oxidoreductase [Sulfitobacter sp. M57]|uniref:flavin-dependent oxidoreductase n=1 Tax=unclassified Sulfitobacter TaxID=196795 RepID=UPI0023E2ECA3|nr:MULTISPECIES: flavin-dependent oxidoreductase [unclassified Sulfitobacter]MDF3415889.1 flavin-dependent oxidoreductase [Sulfitobacter sp. KE5]MDF3423369.1 flavin-dependent oxidoreductase [Sulfitobacter sp. KE43]MDF3434435.1 flavin-dependent oxidoreductase [Sulfitobacter sp. KE42]MDF3460075.1 flavin-dependent oxidoreductase [Sulfitobacter sp. S74]MDF3463973.1 flavin-dependent oxidoreductase [Sulfitobacter sp. Ks18]